MEQCQFCGGTLGAKVRFCSNCGKPVTANSTINVSTPKLGSVIGGTSKIKALPSLTDRDNRASQPVSKFKKPNPLSMDAIQHTVFVVPEHFLSLMLEILGDFGVQAAGIVHSPDPSLLLEMSQQFIRNAPQSKVQYVCIIGDWGEVPPSNVPNDFLMSDGDKFCQTDAFYGATEVFKIEQPLTAIPEITVGRIPVADRYIVQRVLSNDPDVIANRNSFQYGVTAQCWEVASKEIVSSFPNLDRGAHSVVLPDDINALPKSAVLSSPEWTEEQLRQVARSGPSDPFGLIFFNVHGSADEPKWVGESEDGNYVEIFQPGTVSDFNSALLLSEACYGGAMFYDSPSIVEHFFANGGNSFVGSSTIAYGARATPITSADLIAKHYIASLYAGLSQGESLKLAKLEALTEDPLSMEYGLKTVLSFNLFGAPWQTLTRSTTSPASNSSVQSSPARSAGSVLERIRGNLQAPMPFKSNAINKIRDQYRARLPPRNRQFMIETDELLSKLREFQDYSKIKKQVDQWRGSLEDAHMDFVSAGDAKGYRLVCQTSRTNKSQRSLVMIINDQGQLTKTIESKGTL